VKGVAIGDLGGGDDAVDVEIALGGGGGPDDDDAVGELGAEAATVGLETASTASISSSKQARMTRTAISPRLAISTRRRRAIPLRSSLGLDDDDRLAVLDRGAVVDQDRRHDPIDRRGRRGSSASSPRRSPPSPRR